MVGIRIRGRITDRLRVLVIFFLFLIFADGKKICKTKECQRAAATILESMNPYVDPCTNFYQFVCGNFDKDSTRPIQGYDHSVMSNMGDHVDEMVENYLATVGDEEKNQPFSQAFDLFEACANTHAMDEQGIEPLREIIGAIGGWPLVEGVKWEEIRWENITGELAKVGYDSGIFFDAQVVQIDGPVIQLMPAPIEEFTRRSWRKLMIVAKKMGADPNTLPPVESVNHLHSFDVLLPNQRSTLYLTVDEMIKRWPSIDWVSYLTGVFINVPDVTLDHDQMVIASPEYIDELVRVLRVTPAAAIMNYVAAAVVEVSLEYLSTNVVNDPASGLITIPRSSAARRTYCSKLVTKQLPLIVQAIFEVNYVDEHLRTSVMNLSIDLKDQFGKLISKAKWLDSPDKKSCLDKLHAMEFALGYPQDIKDGFYTKDYEGLEIDKNNFAYSMLNINRFQTTKKYIKSIKNEVDAVNDRFPITQVNALYDLRQNRMVIMPGILQDPFINEDLPKYITYSGIGFVLGHETTHGYDRDWEVFDFYLGSNPPQDASKKVFYAEQKCVAQQFQDYVWATYRLQIDGMKYTHENIADDGGTKIAFNAYKKWMKRNGPEPTLPGINYDLMQTFFITLAHTQCGRYNPALVPFLLSQDTHGLHEFRVNAPLSNNPAFAEVFNCPVGSMMNPEERCVIW